MTATPTNPGKETDFFAFRHGWPLGTRLWHEDMDWNWNRLSQLLEGAGESMAFAYDPSTGRLTTVTETLNGKTRTTALTYKTHPQTGKVLLDQVRVTMPSLVRTVTFAYDANARITGTATTETKP